MRVELAKLHRSLDTTMIYVTHDQVEAMTMADKIVVLRDGRIEQVGTPLELYNHPANLFVAGFIGAPRMNFLDVGVTGRSGERLDLTLPGGFATHLPIQDAAVSAGQKMTLGIRPEHLSPAAAGDDAAIAVTVDVVEHLGSGTAVYGRLDGSNTLTMMLPGQHGIQAGERMALTARPEAYHLFDAQGLAVRGAAPAAAAR
jgi:multiple sugar transport system ATP-binding protein